MSLHCLSLVQEVRVGGEGGAGFSEGKVTTDSHLS